MIINPFVLSPSAYLLDDEFTSGSVAAGTRSAVPGPGSETLIDGGSKLSIASSGRLSVSGGSGSWDDPSAWASLDGATFGGAGLVVRTRGDSNSGPALILHSAANANPTTTGRGLYYVQPDLFQVTGTNKIETYGTRVRSIDYVFAVIRRTSGGDLIAVSGGAYGTFPSATLLWVDDSDSIGATAYLGLTNKSGGWEADALRVLKTTALPVALQTRYGAAIVADTFTRADSSTIGSTEIGSKTWTKTGTAAISSNAARLTSSFATLELTPGANAKIFDVTVTAASGGTVWVSLFCRNGTGNLIDFQALNDKVVLNQNGSLVTQTGSFTLAAGATKRMRIIDFGTRIMCFLDDVLVLEGTVSSTGYNSGTAGFYIGDRNAAAGYVFDNYAVWGPTLTLPTEFAPPVTVPAGTGSALVSDTFTNTNGTALSTHNAAWSTSGSGSWEINSNKARISAANTTGYAVRSTTTTADHEVSADVTTPNTTPTFPTDWYCGVVARWTDSTHYLLARFLYQDNSTEIELEQANGGAGAIVGYVNLGAGGVAANTTYALKLACKGSEAAVYLAGELVIQATVALVTGTSAGMGVEGPMSGQPSFDNFSVKAT